MATGDDEVRDPRPAASGHRAGRIWDRWLDALSQVDVGRPADQVLRRIESKAKDLGRRERRQLRDSFYGFLRSRRMVQDQLTRAMAAERRPLDTLSPPLRQELELMAYLALEGELPQTQVTKRFGPVLKRIATGRLPKTKRSPEGQAAIDANVPDWLFARWVEDRGLEGAVELGRSLRNRAPVTVFVRGGADARDAFVASLADAAPTARAPSGAILPPGSMVPDRDDIELQDEGSQLLSLAAASPAGGVQPRRILDACAGAGGKTLALCDLAPAAELTAVEPAGARLSEARRRARRAGVETRVRWRTESLEDHARAHPGRYDVVLVDAPCSGTGTLRRHPDVALRLEAEQVSDHVASQRRLVASAAQALAPGGTLVYATCSVLPEENEGVADYLLEHGPGLRPVPVFGDRFPDLVGTRVRIGPGPDETGPDGFFVAAFRKAD